MRPSRSFLFRAAFAVLLVSGPATAGPATFVPDANMSRSEIPNLYKWDLGGLFESDAAWDASLKRVDAERERLTTFEGRLSDPASLRKCLDLYFEVRLATNKLTMYAGLRFETAKESTELQARNDRALAAMNELMAKASFIRQEILALDDAAMADAYVREKGLVQYRGYIDDIRRRRSHVLGPQAEHVLSLAGDNLWAEIDLNELPSDHEKTFGAMMGDIPLPTITDEHGEEVQLAFANYPRYRRSEDRRVRRDTVEGMFGALRQFQHVFAGTFAGQINTTIFFTRARGYDSCLEAYLDRDDIDPRVYRGLIEAVRANLDPLHRYVQLRKKVMGLDELRFYDLYPPLVEGVESECTFEQAREILPAAFAPFGEEYVQVIRHGLDPANGWIDLYPHDGKESGAFCASVYGVHPVMKMNFFNDADGLGALAHEFGHALHSHLAMNSQPYWMADYSSFNAEIASTCNEKFLHDYQMRNAKTKEEKLSLLNDLLETIRGTIYRQTLFADFELRAHEAAEGGTPITADLLDELYADLVRTYYGPGFTVGENDGMEWAYVGHFYYKFYIYTYATGLSAGIALAERIQTGDPAAVEAYLGMLKAGNSKPPLELLQDAGVDLTKPDAIEAAARLMDRTLTEMEKLLDS